MDTDPDSMEPRSALPLERGYVRSKLIRELAEEIKGTGQLAEEYGVSAQSIRNFKQRHATRIEQQRADFENEFADLWIANKRARLEMLQDDIDATADNLESDVVKVRHAAMHQAAKELGQVPSTSGVQVQMPTVTFKIEGVDLEQLK